MEIFLLDLGALSVPLTAFVRNPTVKRIYSTVEMLVVGDYVQRYTTC
jgi:hypothetical protein